MNTSLSLGLLCARVSLGLYFFLAGYGKIFSTGVNSFVAGSIRLLPAFMPPALGKAYLYALPYGELIVGAMLVIGAFTRTSGLLTALMLLSIIIATGITGGVGPFHHGAVMLGAAILLALAGGGAYSADQFFVVKRRKSASNVGTN